MAKKRKFFSLPNSDSEEPGVTVRRRLVRGSLGFAASSPEGPGTFTSGSSISSGIAAPVRASGRVNKGIARPTQSSGPQTSMATNTPVSRSKWAIGFTIETPGALSNLAAGKVISTKYDTFLDGIGENDIELLYPDADDDFKKRKMQSFTRARSIWKTAVRGSEEWQKKSARVNALGMEVLKARRYAGLEDSQSARPSSSDAIAQEQKTQDEQAVAGTNELNVDKQVSLRLLDMIRADSETSKPSASLASLSQSEIPIQSDKPVIAIEDQEPAEAEDSDMADSEMILEINEPAKDTPDAVVKVIDKAADMRITARDSEGVSVIFLVSSKSLSRAGEKWYSLAFSAIESAPDRTPSRTSGQQEIPDTSAYSLTMPDEDSAEALEIIFNLIYYRFDSIPHQVMVPLLHKLAIIADKYDCSELVRGCSYQWSQCVPEAAMSSGDTNWFRTAWVFGLQHLFFGLLADAMSQSRPKELDLYLSNNNQKLQSSLPVKESALIIGFISELRFKMIRSLEEFCQQYTNIDFWEKQTTCNQPDEDLQSLCKAANFGRFMKGMQRLKLFGSLSIAEIGRELADLPTVKVHEGSESQCGIQIFKERVKDTFNNLSESSNFAFPDAVMNHFKTMSLPESVRAAGARPRPSPQT
ncbi:hypothetical protein EJ08DRAFT_695513 [Tothia fuscella]|uniref:Uncharacterized protein n=1 Tax=Tothia fuscella TaxID=1048955 RepID=A0A9P4NVC0_9PEZI|nr:hypothetical protein EJ08DRAFT_695513 [Tothia fuscella]